MSYADLPPPISSSPPPLDDCNSIEEEEINNDLSDSPTFDITGLSEKLPATPEHTSDKANHLPITLLPPSESFDHQDDHPLSSDTSHINTNETKTDNEGELMNKLPHQESLHELDSFGAFEYSTPDVGVNYDDEDSSLSLAASDDLNELQQHRQINNDKCSQDCLGEFNESLSSADKKTLFQDVLPGEEERSSDAENIGELNAFGTPQSADDDFGDFADFSSMSVINSGNTDESHTEIGNTALDEASSAKSDDCTLYETEPSTEFVAAFNDQTSKDSSENNALFVANKPFNETVIEDDVVLSCYLPTIEGETDTGSDEFGYSQITDDQSIANNKDRVVVEATNEHLKEAYSEVVTDGEDSIEIEKEACEKFVYDADSNSNEDSIEFDEFASAKIDNAFVEDDSCNNIKDDIVDDDEDDDFGDFSGPTTNESFLRTSLSRGTSVDSNSGVAGDKKSPALLTKIESLVQSWLLHSEDTELKSQQFGAPFTSLKEVVNDDAFVWRKLECMDWQTIVWQSCAAQSHLLSALNVDARNILFNQKWSSSVPVFAQSLSFSPLTPVKPTSAPCRTSSLYPPQNKDVSDAPLHTINIQDLEDPPSLQEKESYSHDSAAAVAGFDWLADNVNDSPEGCGEPSKPPSSSAVMSAAVQQLLALPHTTPVTQLTQKERDFLQSLPDLRFMTSKVLMFPVKGES